MTGVTACSDSSATGTLPDPFQPPKVICPAAPAPVTSPNGQPVTVSYGAPDAKDGTPPVSINCTPANNAAFPVGTTTVTCTATDAESRTDSCGFMVVVKAGPKLSVTRFMAFGDSITAGENGAASLALSVPGRPVPHVILPGPETYPGVLQTELQARYTAQAPTVDNNGQPGEAAANASSRFRAVLSARPYDVVILMEGSNDLGTPASASAGIAGLNTMLQIASASGLRAFLATIPPMNPSGVNGHDAALVPPFNDQVRALAAADHVQLVDIYSVLNASLTQYIGPDGEHPTVAGYAKIADTFFTAIQSTFEVSSSVTTTAAQRATTGVRPPAAPVSAKTPPRRPR